MRSRAREAIEKIHDSRLSDEDCEELFKSVAKPEVPHQKYPREPRIFISYSRRNAVFADWLVGELKAANVRVWLDRLDIADEDATEAQLIDAIEPGIRGSDYLALIFVHSNDAWWVQRELRIARLYQHVRNPTTVFALSVDGTDLTDVLEYYSPLVRFDFSDPRDYGTPFRALLEQIPYRR